MSNTTNPNCPQSLVDSNPLPTNNYIRPVPPVSGAICRPIQTVVDGMMWSVWP